MLILKSVAPQDLEINTETKRCKASLAPSDLAGVSDSTVFPQAEANLTLLEKAKAEAKGRTHLVSEEDIDLLIAFARREIDTTQVGRVVGKSSSSATWHLGGIAMKAIRQGLIKIEKVERS